MPHHVVCLGRTYVMNSVGMCCNVISSQTLVGYECASLCVFVCFLFMGLCVCVCALRDLSVKLALYDCVWVWRLSECL